jgi:hypothetical protein
MEPDPQPDSLPPEPKWPSAAASVFAWAHQHLPPASADLREQQQLEQELAEARAELAAVHELLDDIPRIFERKFQQRLQPILNDNAHLRRQLQQLQGSPETRSQLQLPPTPRQARIRQALRHAFGLPPSSRRDAA